MVFRYRKLSRLFEVGAILFVMFVLNGCGLMINGTKQEIRFDVEPKDATIFVDNQELVGNRIELERKDSHRYRVVHPIYGEVEGRIPNTPDMAPVILDLLFWPAYLVDIPTGGLYHFKQDRIIVRLQQEGKTPSTTAKQSKPSQPEPKLERTAQPPPSVSQPAITTEGQRWALVVGISNYEDQRIPKIPNAAEDARAVRDFLVQPDGGGYQTDHVFLLTDYDATTRKLERYLKNELKKKIQREDDLFIYFACHGMVIPKPGTGSEDGLEKYLIPYDTISEDVTVDGLSMTDLQGIFDLYECQQVAMVLDTCFSGAGGRSIATGPKTRNTTISSSFLRKLAKQRGDKRRKVISACSADELAQDDPDTGHGIFTTYFLQALDKADDTDGNGFITLYEIFRYLDRKVRERSAEIGQRQHPQMVGDSAFPFNMKKVSP